MAIKEEGAGGRQRILPSSVLNMNKAEHFEV